MSIRLLLATSAAMISFRILLTNSYLSRSTIFKRFTRAPIGDLVMYNTH